MSGYCYYSGCQDQYDTHYLDACSLCRKSLYNSDIFMYMGNPRFLDPDIMAPYDYIFIWDEDLGVEHFNAEKHIKLARREATLSGKIKSIKEVQLTGTANIRVKELEENPWETPEIEARKDLKAQDWIFHRTSLEI
ncbi:Detected protein of unknown function [Hibiscus syriacus]|uniref:Uncharacterized protein n=1 Tax=Hibiscus syriacus TaxID=106335 RepID=A0A6A2YM33_HIBSY|nr:Detected protein of unknown function [Hibiscus syriacus]